MDNNQPLNQLAIHHEDGMGVSIIRLGGSHSRCPETCRVTVGEPEPLLELYLTDIASRKCDTAIWGSGMTWTITEAEAETYRALNASRLAAKSTKAEADQAAAREYAAAHPRSKEIPGVNVPCPRCHSYCYGDCTA